MEALVLSNISKIYSNGVIANDRVNFRLAKGEIHAIVGENGAGKTTFMKILYGLEKPDSGEIRLDGRPVMIASPGDAIRHGIGMLPQHSMLINEMTVCENIFLGIEKTRHGWLGRKAMREETLALCRKYNMRLDPDALCGSLSVSSAQKVSILKALSRGIRILILDEPTAVLAPQEIEELFGQLRVLKGEGYSVIIITHKLREIKQLCDRVTIMRAGRDCGVFDVDGISDAQISRLMVGGELEGMGNRPRSAPGMPVLEVRDLCVTRTNRTLAVDHAGFSVRRGEIVCLAGVEGNGQRETVRCITGMEKGYTGTIRLMGSDIAKMDIRQIRRLGLSHIPEDRLRTGSNPRASIIDNFIAVPAAGDTAPWIIPYRRLKEFLRKVFAQFSVKTKDPAQPMASLSGGNMQKVILARELGVDSPLVVADQPTRGVDVGSTLFIHRKLLQMRDAGKAILLVSADLGEVLSLSDRVLVYFNGRITAQITDVSGIREEKLGRYMLGLEKMTRLECA